MKFSKRLYLSKILRIRQSIVQIKLHWNKNGVPFTHKDNRRFLCKYPWYKNIYDKEKIHNGKRNSWRVWLIREQEFGMFERRKKKDWERPSSVSWNKFENVYVCSAGSIEWERDKHDVINIHGICITSLINIKNRIYTFIDNNRNLPNVYKMNLIFMILEEVCITIGWMRFLHGFQHCENV